jgi:hypothetical protein
MTKKSTLKTTAAVPATSDAFVDPLRLEADTGTDAKPRRAPKRPRRGRIKLPRGTARRSRRSPRAPSLFRRPGRGRASPVDSRATSNSVLSVNFGTVEPAAVADCPADDGAAANEQAVRDSGEPVEAHSTGKAISVEVRQDSLAVGMPVDAEATWESLTAEFDALNEKGVESVVGRGLVILRGRAKDNPEGRPHGNFGPWLVDQLRLGKNKKAALWQAGMFMQIAQHPIISDRKYWRCLPGAYRTLWELTHVPEEVLVRCINEGLVHHDLSRQEAERLKKEVLDAESSDGEKSERESSGESPKSKLPLPPIPNEVAVLLKVVRYFISDKILRAHMGANKGVSDFPSDSELDAAVQKAKDEHLRMRGGR